MPSHFTLRMQFGIHKNEKEVTSQLLKLVREAPVDEIMFFYFGEEQNDGHETIERIKEWIDSSRPYREALKKVGVKISLNPWHSMLHCDRGRKLKPGQNWQKMIDPKGAEASAVVCFLDPDWRRYYLETLKMYSKEGFRVVWIDDDIRYHNHGPLEWGGCFCPLHIAEFNKRAGTNASHADIVRACLAPGEPHPWRAIWMDMWQETILEFLNECRRVLEKTGTKMGLMSSAMESHAAEGRHWNEWWQAFGGGKPPVHRPHFWTYGDTMGSHIIHGIAALDQNRSIQPNDIETGPEIECFPYGNWNKSFRQISAQVSLAHILGSTNLNISMYDFMGNNFDDEPQRASFLKNIRPNMNWLADNFPMTMRSQGVGVPWIEDLSRKARLTRGTSWYELQSPTRGWAYWLGAASLAFSARAQQNVNAIAGPMAWAFDEALLKQWLAKGLLLDGTAAAILVQRGLGNLIGIKSSRFITQNDVLYSLEECTNPDFALRAGGQISVNEKNHTSSMLQAELAKGAFAISDLHDPLQRVVGHGTVLFENELGGRTAVVPWNASSDDRPMMDIHRATQMKRVASWLSNGKEPGGVEGNPWLIPQFLNDGKSWRGVIWNASPDTIETFTIIRPHGMPPVKKAFHLSPDGKRVECPVKNDTIRLDSPMHEWEFVVVE